MKKKIISKKKPVVIKELDKVVGGPTRRAELDHVGAYNFMVEIQNTLRPK